MGPNGSGKSTLANVIAGRLEYTITSGEILYDGRDITAWFPEARARQGIFLAMQYPVELPGVRTWQFLKAAVDSLRKHRGESEFSVRPFDRLLDSKRELDRIDDDLIRRSVNEGYSGGSEEAERDPSTRAPRPQARSAGTESDSGLDMDALRIVAYGVNGFRGPDQGDRFDRRHQSILKGISLTVNEGRGTRDHGPNGSGKSTLANVIAGRPEYTITSGEILYDGRDITAWFPEARAREGIFLAMQYPVELPGVRTWQFLKAAVDSLRKQSGVRVTSYRSGSSTRLKLDSKDVSLSASTTTSSDARSTMRVRLRGREEAERDPSARASSTPGLLCWTRQTPVWTSTRLRIVADGVNGFRGLGQGDRFGDPLPVRILNYITPDFVNVLVDGRIVRSGGKDLALELEEKGYDWIQGGGIRMIGLCSYTYSIRGVLQ